MQKVPKFHYSFEQSPNERTPNEKDFPHFTPKRKINRIALISLSSVTQVSDTMVTPTPKSNYNVKPKKSAVPTPIGTNSDKFNCPAFRSDNNILEVSHEKCADSARDFQKSHFNLSAFLQVNI